MNFARPTVIGHVEPVLKGAAFVATCACGFAYPIKENTSDALAAFIAEHKHDCGAVRFTVEGHLCEHCNEPHPYEALKPFLIDGNVIQICRHCRPTLVARLLKGDAHAER